MKLNLTIRIIAIISFLTIFLFLYNKTYFSFFALNLFLAYIPFEIANLTNYTNNKLLVILIFIPWLLFYPNSPYILTDFVHIEVLNLYGSPFSDNLNSWLLFSLSTLFILFGFLVGAISFIKIIRKINKLFFNNSKYSLVTLIIIISIISGYAIYLGRFPRLHTHYILQDPLKIFKIAIDNISYKSLLFSIIMAIWQVPLLLIINNSSLNNK